MLFKVKVKGIIVLLLGAVSTVVHPQAPKIVPVAPEAAALAKEVNYPISPNLGLADISLPLTEIESGGMVLPIALSYHSGGFKTNERSTSVGLGFSLTCDIQISRTINGLDDLIPSRGYIFNDRMKAHVPGADYYYTNYYFYNLAGYNLRSACASITGDDAQFSSPPNADGMPDKFSYRLLNKSGSFYFRKNRYDNGYTIVTVPYDNTIKIIYNGKDNYPNSFFTIIDSDGTTYYFGDFFKEQQIEQYSNSVTSWKCSRIENASKTAYFDFAYVSKSPVGMASYPEQIEVKDNVDACGFSYHYPYRDIDFILDQFPYLRENAYAEDVQTHVSKTPIITTSFPDGRKSVRFFSPSDPSHFKSYNFRDRNGLIVPPRTSALALSSITFREGKVVFSGTDELDYIKVLDGSGAEVKTFDLIQSYTLPANLTTAKVFNGDSFKGTLYLDGVEVRKGGAVIEKYGLMYNTKYCFGNHLIGKDAWGYPNDYTQDISYTNGMTPTNIPQKHLQQTATDRIGGTGPASGPCVTQQVEFDIGNSTNTEIASRNPRYWGMLERIIQSAGGCVAFKYEPNMYKIETANGFVVRTGGGYRIKSVTYFDGASTKEAWQKYYQYGELEDGIGTVVRTPDSQFDLENYQYKGYSYSKVYTFVGEDDFDSKVTYYEPASSLDYNYQNGAFIYYTKVTEYNSDLGASTGKRVYSYYPPGEFQILDPRSKIEGTTLTILRADGLMGQQKSVNEYKFENGRYSLVHGKEYTYQKHSEPEQVKVVYVYQQKHYSFNEGLLAGIYPVWTDVTKSEYLNGHASEAYLYGDYGLEVAKVLLTSETETWVRNGNTFSETTRHHYDNTNYLQPSRIVTTNSKGEEITKTIRYAYDFADDVYVQMKARNMISQPVEEVVFNNTLNKEISRTRTNYGVVDLSPSATFIAPVSRQRSDGGAALHTLLTYDKYDEYGNVLQITGEDKVPVSYLWGYNKQYVIAEVKGATYNQVENANGSVSLETLLTTTDNSVITQGIDERRPLLPFALIASFTHKPLVGVSSRTDAAGQKNFFSYDEAGRLSHVFDESALLKSYDYNLVNGPYSVFVPYLSAEAPVMETFYTTCYNGSQGVIIPYNQVVHGGNSSKKTIWTDRELVPEGNSVGNLNCTAYESLSVAKIQIVSKGISGAYLDVIKDGTVLYTKPFIQRFTDPMDYYTAKEFYVPAGEYVISLRLDDGAAVYAPIRMDLDDGDREWNVREIKPGQSLKLDAGTTYSFVIYEREE